MGEYHVERRKCRRFEILGAKVRYKKTGLFAFRKGFSEAYPMVNVSKGGLGFACGGKFGQGKRVVVQLLVPKENPLNLHGRVRWQIRPRERSDTFIGVQFMPFGDRRGWNSPNNLDVLRRLEALYGKDLLP